jgi:hypothetical protein
MGNRLGNKPALAAWFQDAKLAALVEGVAASVGPQAGERAVTE